MNVLVTGSSGFCGKNLTKYLKKNGFTVLGLDYQLFGDSNFWNKENMPAQEEVKSWLDEYGVDGFIKYRLGTFEEEVQESILEKLQGVNVIVHLASQSHVDRSIKNPRQFIDDNVSGTVELFEMARQMPNLQRIILFGTDEVVACLEKGEADEKTLMNCGSVYSASKGAQELLAQAYIKKYNLPIITTRCVNIFGPMQADEKFIPTVIRSIMTGEKIPIYGSGYQSRQWVHVDHVCDVLNWLCVNTIIPDGNILHITGTSEIANIVMTHLLITLSGKSGEISHVEDRIGHDERYALADGEAQLVWDMPKYSTKKLFMEDLRETVKFYVEKYSADEFQFKKIGSKDA